MKMAVLVTLIAAACAAPLHSETLVQRVDTVHDGKPSYSVLYFGKQFDVLAFDADGDFPIYELEKLVCVKADAKELLLVGGCFSYWEKTDKTFLEPYVLYERYNGKTTIHAEGMVYLPLNGGGTSLGLNEGSVSQKVGNGFAIGLDAHFYKTNPGTLLVGSGPIVSYTKGKNTVKVRYSPWGGTSTSVRLEISRKL